MSRNRPTVDDNRKRKFCIIKKNAFNVDFVFIFQVAEITKIMKAYINMIVKKRCSVKSVSSYGTNWIR